MKKKTKKKYNLGGTLQQLAPLAGLIPGFGGIASGVMGAAGSLMSNLSQQRKQNELDAKASIPKNNTPTGVLGTPNYKYGGKLSKKQLTKLQKLLLGGEIEPVDPVDPVEPVDPMVTIEKDNAARKYVLSQPTPDIVVPKKKKYYPDDPEYMENERKERLKAKTKMGPESNEDLLNDMIASMSGKLGGLRTSQVELLREKNPIGMSMYLDKMQKEDKNAWDNFSSTYADIAKDHQSKKAAAKTKGLTNSDLTTDEVMKLQFDSEMTDRLQKQFNKSSSKTVERMVYPDNKNVTAEDNFKYGGKMTYQHGGNLKQYNGPKHDNGGIPVDGMGNPTPRGKASAEVEGGETYKDGYVFSDSLMNITGNTFAEDSKRINSKYKRGNADWLATNTKELEMKRLEMKNDQMRSFIEEPSEGMPEMKSGGYLKNKSTYVTKDGKETKRGLWANVHLKKKREGKMAYGGKLPKYNNGGGVLADNTSTSTDYTNVAGLLGLDGFPMDNMASDLPAAFNTGLNMPQGNSVTGPMPTTKPKPTVQSNVGGNKDLKLTVGDKMQMASNFVAPAYNLATALQGYDQEPEQKNLNEVGAVNRLKNLKVRQDLNPIIAQGNATRASINANATGSQRLASLLGLQKQVGSTLDSATRNTANQNAQLSSQLSQTELQLGERNRAEANRAKATTDANQAAQANLLSKAFEQLGPALGSIGSGKNSRLENVMSYNLLKQMFPDFTPEQFDVFMKSQGNKAIKYTGSKYKRSTNDD